MCKRRCMICGDDISDRHISALKCLKQSCAVITIKQRQTEVEAISKLLVSFHLYSNIPINREPTKDERSKAEMLVAGFIEDFSIRSLKPKKVDG